MEWFLIEGKAQSLRKAVKSCTEQKLLVVRGDSMRSGISHAWVGSGNDHANSWTQKIARDFGVNISPSEEPRWMEALCGAKLISTMDIERHIFACAKCRSLNGMAPVSPRKTGLHKKDVVTISAIVISPTEVVTLENILSMYRNKYDEAMLIAMDYDQVVKAIENLRNAEVRLSELKEEIDNDRKSLLYFLRPEEK